MKLPSNTWFHCKHLLDVENPLRLVENFTIKTEKLLRELFLNSKIRIYAFPVIIIYVLIRFPMAYNDKAYDFYKAGY